MFFFTCISLLGLHWSLVAICHYSHLSKCHTKTVNHGLLLVKQYLQHSTKHSPFITNQHPVRNPHRSQTEESPLTGPYTFIVPRKVMKTALSVIVSIVSLFTVDYGPGCNHPNSHYLTTYGKNSENS